MNVLGLSVDVIAHSYHVNKAESCKHVVYCLSSVPGWCRVNSFQHPCSRGPAVALRKLVTMSP